MTEQGFWEHVIEIAKLGEMGAINLIAQRLMPALKPSSELIHEGLLPNGWLDLSRSSPVSYTHLTLPTIYSV